MVSQNRDRSTIPLDLYQAYSDIHDTAKHYLNNGHIHIWIYIKAGQLAFYRSRMEHLYDCYCGHFLCQRILDGLPNKTWRQLGARIARVHYAQETP